MPDTAFSPSCTRCPRLATFLEEVRHQHPDYYAKPVPPFGDANAKLLIVGLAPGYHGTNASGGPFTGDYAGILLYQTLYECGLSTALVSRSVDDGLKLINCRITNAVKCLPPQNKPESSEINTCNTYLKTELQALRPGSVLLALGNIAHASVIKALGLKLSQFKFGHGNEHVLPNLTLVESYHCSRYNTQTKRLTADMFKAGLAQQAQQFAASVNQSIPQNPFAGAPPQTGPGGQTPPGQNEGPTEGDNPNFDGPSDGSAPALPGGFGGGGNRCPLR